MCSCVFVRDLICVYICGREGVCMCVFVCVSVCVCIKSCTYVCEFVCVYMYGCVYVRMCGLHLFVCFSL